MSGDPAPVWGQHKKNLLQFILFAGIGAIGTAGHYLALILLVELLDVQPGIATSIGFVVGAIINYLLNYRITFNSNKKHHEAMLKFMLIALFGALINYAIMQAGTLYTHLHYLLIQLVATGLVLVWNFTLNKVWTFAEEQVKHTESD